MSGARRVRFAGLPAASTIMPPPALSASVPLYCRPPSAASPASTTYLNIRLASPSDPSTYMALLGGSVASANVGLPVALTGSSKTTAIPTVSPAP